MPDIDIGLLSPTAAQANDAMVVRRGVDPTETVALVALADFATAAQGALADSAVQPGDLAAVATSGSASDLGSGTLPVARIADGSLALSKLANLATSTILGRATAGTGVPEALSAAQVRTIINVADGATANATDAFLLARANHTGTQAASTITGLAAVATSGSASDLSAGTLPAARFDDTAHGSRAGGSLHANATTSVAGFMSDADKLKLDGIASGAQVNVPTNLSYDAATRTIASDTGTDAVLPLVDNANPGLIDRPHPGPTRAVTYTDFISTNTDWPGAGGGTGNASGITGSPDGTGFGWWVLSTGTTATGRASVFAPTASLINFSNGFARFRGLLRLPILSDGTETFTIRAGFIDSQSAESTDGAFFRYTHSVNGGRFEAVCRFAGVETAADTGITVAATTSYAVDVRVSAGVATFYIDGVLVATINTNVPSGGANTAYGFYIQKSAGLTNRNMQMDYALVEQSLTRS